MIKKIIFTILILVMFISFGNAREKSNLDITSLDIKFVKMDAIFTVYYDIGDFPRLYVLIFGSKGLVPIINSTFSNFNYEIIGLDEYKATLRVNNLSRFDKGYYLYDSEIKFGQGIRKMNVYLPGSSEPKVYQNLFIFDWDNVPGADEYSLINFLKHDIDVSLPADLGIYKEINNKSIIGIKGTKNKEKLFEITLDNKTGTSFLYLNGSIYNLIAVNNNGKFYIYSPFIYSIPNVFYRS